MIAVGANPGSPNIDEEIRRFEYKVEAGAELAVTQPVFDIRLLEEFMKKIEHCKVPVVAGIWPLTSTRNAEFMKNELRVSIPDEIFERMAKATTADAARAEGVAIARDMLAAVKDMVQGAQISAPFGRYSCAVDVLEALGDTQQERRSVDGGGFRLRCAKLAPPALRMTSIGFLERRRSGCSGALRSTQNTPESRQGIVMPLAQDAARARPG